METTEDEPVTPSGRLFLRPELSQIINCAMGFEHQLNIEALKSEIASSLMIKHPRFCSLLVLDKQGKEFWRKTRVNLDDHIIIHHETQKLVESDESDDNVERIMNEYLADFAVSSPLSTEKPLWEIHVLCGLKCAIFRFHHALGDGITLITLFLASFKKADGDGDAAKNRGNRGRVKKEERENGFWRVLKVIWYTIVDVMCLIGRSLWVRDKKTVMSGGDGVELWPRMLATAKFRLEDMKTVKTAIPNATINDVLFGIISCGLSRYLNVRSSHDVKEGLQLTGLALVSLRRPPTLEEISKLSEEGFGSLSKLGNQFGAILLPVYFHMKDNDPLSYVKRAKVMMDKKKQSLESHFSYKISSFLMSCFGPKAASVLNYKIACNTTFTITNVVGPQEEYAFASNRITYLRSVLSAIPHALTMSTVSYAGKVDMQILVAKDIIPDPQFLAKCFEDALLEMKNTANNIII